MSDHRHQARTAARLAAVQALYQMETAGDGVEQVVLEFKHYRIPPEAGENPTIKDENDAAPSKVEDEASLPLSGADNNFFTDLMRGVVEGQARIDRQIQARLAKGWTLSRLDATARAVLRAGVYELCVRVDIPYRVVIDEYLDIAKAFFEDDDSAFINGVLDAVAREARSDEIVKAV